MILTYILTIDTETGESVLTPQEGDVLGLFAGAKPKRKKTPDGGAKAPETPGNRAMAADFMRIFNTTCAGLAKVRMLSAKRVEKCALRAAEMGGASGLPQSPDAVFADVCKKVAASPFLNGENDRGWKCSFDWLMENDTNWVRAYEGYYDKAKTKNGNTINDLW